MTTYALTVDGESEDQFAKLMQLAECGRDVSKLVRQALNVYSVLLAEVAAGGQIIVVKNGEPLYKLHVV